ncbi:hypothetical protein KAR91_31840 [Candidatus Pacearchaeota archaeon]|nr:hypothetical protein [Candidatus Pacearchaeota archaeon]
MKKLLLSLILLVLMSIPAQAIPILYRATVLTGGGTYALDALDGDSLADLDSAIVITTGQVVYFYTLDDDSGVSESSPEVISPDTNAGTKRWILVGVFAGSTITSRSPTPSIKFGDSDTTDDDDNGKIFLNCTDTGSGTEDCDITLQQQVAGSLVNLLFGDADGTGTARLVVPNDSIGSVEIDTIVESIVWNAAGITADGTQCADSAKVTINSGPVMYTIICTDNDASSMYGHVIMPDSWDAGTVTVELEYLQTAADTAVLNSDVAAQCRGATETPSSTWGTEIAIDDAAVSGTNAVDHTTSAAVTPAGTCAAGDSFWWRIQLDATGTTTAVATLHFLGVKMEYTSNVGD